jgi:hypothetical protein
MKKTSKGMEILVNGTLITDICMSLAKPNQAHLPPFIPENPSLKILKSMFMEEEYADINFEVGEQQENENTEMMGKATSVLPTH